MRSGTIAALAAVTLGTSVIGYAAIGTAPARAQQLDTVNLVGCALDGGVCKMPYPTNVYYGVVGKTNGRPFPQGGVVACNAQTFGDPAPGQAKSCWYAPRMAANRGGGGGARNRDDDDDVRGRGRDDVRGGRDYDRPVRRPYDDGDRGSERRYRGDPDRY